MARSTWRVWYQIKGESEVSASLVSAKDESDAMGKIREKLAKEGIFATYPQRPEKLS